MDSALNYICAKDSESLKMKALVMILVQWLKAYYQSIIQGWHASR